MGKTIVADENVQNILLDISSNEGFTPGLIIGQPSEKKDFAIHIAPTRRILDDSTSSDCCVKDIGQIEEGWLKVHFKNVTRSLPGGIYVIGLFIVSAKDVFSDKVALQKVRSLVSNLHSISKSNSYLCGCNQPKDFIVLYFCSTSKKYQCKSFDVQNMSLSMNPANWKFVKNPTGWFRIDCTYDLSTLLSYDSEKKQSFVKTSKDLLHYFKNNVDDCLFFVSGFIDKKDTSYTLEAIRELLIKVLELNNKKSSKVKEQDLQRCLNVFEAVMIKEEPAIDDDNDDDDDKNAEKTIKEYQVEESIDFNGFISSHVYLHRSASLEQAVNALKEDIVRSMAARLELHCDSLEDTPLNDNVAHLLPRRVAVIHNPNGIVFTDYMFPDDTKEDIVNNIKEQMGIDVSPESIIPLESLHSKPVKEDSADNDKDKIYNTEIKSTSNSSPKILVFSLIGAFIVLIVSLIVQFLL